MKLNILMCCGAWVFLIAASIFHGAYSRKRSVGLPLAYVINVAIMHCGALLYLSNDYNHRYDPYLKSFNFDEETVFKGLLATTIGMFCFLAGNLLADSIQLNHRPDERRWPIRRVILCLVVIAAGSFAATLVLPVISSIQAVLGAGRNAALCACALGFAVALHQRKNRHAVYFFLASFLVPIFYLLAFGFISFGIIFSVTLISFCVFQFKLTPGRLAVGILPAALIAYLGLSVFVGYMQNRAELRKVLWSDQGLEDRIRAVNVVWSRIGLFDPTEDRQLYLIDSRLNHNILVGKAIETLERNPTMYANGETVANAFLAWVPRFLWPNKPVNGGSAFISRFTGQRFDSKTTMQSGQVFEFYVNFGWPGVAIGMVLLGIVVRLIDTQCKALLSSMNLERFAKLHLIGISLILPTGQLFFLISAAAASVVLGIILNRLLNSSLFVNIQDGYLPGLSAHSKGPMERIF